MAKKYLFECTDFDLDNLWDSTETHYCEDDAQAEALAKVMLKEFKDGVVRVYEMRLVTVQTNL